MARGYIRDADADESAKRWALAVFKAREELGITRRQLARYVGVTVRHIIRAEREGFMPVSHIFFPICEQLGINPSELGFKGCFKNMIDQWTTKS